MLETWWSWISDILASCRKFMQSSGEYRNTFKFIENPLNSIKQITKIDVNTNYDLIYDGVLYFNNSPVTIPSTETVVTKNVKKKSRFNILKNYLSNSNPKSKFKNRYQVENAIRKINDEMEDAQKEFSKLFQNNEKDYN